MTEAATIAMSPIDSEKYRQICREVWRDRASILEGHGDVNGETALIRAVYWRLCKTGDQPDENMGDTPHLKELIQQYRNEMGKS
jgi:hypothetical protein